MPSPPLQLGPMLGRTWEIFRRHWLLICLIHLTVALPVGLVIGYAATQSSSQEYQFRLALLSVVFNLIFVKVGHAAIFAALSRIWSGRTPTYGNAWFVAMDRLQFIVTASVCVAVLVAAGTALLIIPGIVLSVWLAFTLCIVMDEKCEAWPAVERSAKLALGRFWQIFGYLIAVYFPTWILLSSVELLVAAVVPDHWALEAALDTVILTPLLFAVVFTFVLYRSLRAAVIIDAPMQA